MAETALTEPGWLAARRVRAAVLTGELGLPTFKGTPGWEFTELKGLELAWRSAEEVAAIADDLLLPDSVRVRMHAAEEQRGGADDPEHA